MERNCLLSWFTPSRILRHLTHRKYFSTSRVSNLFSSKYSAARKCNVIILKGLFPTNLQHGLTISTIRLKTTAIYNAQKDDEGNDMRIEITPRASNRLREIMIEDSNPNLALRINVESGGCHGFQYLMSLITLPKKCSVTASPHNKQYRSLSESSDYARDKTPQIFVPANLNDIEKEGVENTPLSENDTIFLAEDGSGAKVVMSKSSLNILKGSKIDYTMELIGSQFKIVDNPLAISSCGCGTSFDIKE